MHSAESIGFLSIRPLVKDDLQQFLNVRNSVRFSLHDSREFTLDECLEWFEKTETRYFAIFHVGTFCGYFRLYFDEDFYAWVGLDLHPKFQGRGYSKLIYGYMLNRIKNEYTISGFRLKVLKQNLRAISLYENLGFQTFLEDNDSYVMDKAINSIEPEEKQILKDSKILNGKMLHMHSSLSVIVLCHNQRIWLSECLESLIQQKTSFRFKVIIHDDASTDGSDKQILHYCEKYPEIFCSILQNKNLFSNNNVIFQELIELSNAQMISRLDADDFLTTDDVLQRAMDAFDNEKTLFTFGDYFIQNEKVGNLKRIDVRKTSKLAFRNDKSFLFGNRYCYNAVFFRNAIISFPRSFKKLTSQDWMLWSMLSISGKSVKIMGPPVGVYRVHWNNRYSGQENRKYLADLRAILSLSQFDGSFLNRLIFSPLSKTKLLFIDSKFQLLRGINVFLNVVFNSFLSVKSRNVTFPDLFCNSQAKALRDLFSRGLRVREGEVNISPIRFRDINLLRRNKNLNKDAFFFQKYISFPMQLKWYFYFRKRETDQIFLVHSGDTKIGCFGLRVKYAKFDFYNLMRFELSPKSSQSTSLGQSIIQFLNQIQSICDYPIQAKVLINNPALDWYHKNHFEVIQEGVQHFTLNYRLKEKGI